MSKKLIYAGIGSRNTPIDMLNYFTKIGRYFASKEWILRSGGADGCDLAFENGCNELNGQKEIYLPWNGFNNSTSKLVVNNNEAFEIAKKFHPRWEYLSQGAQRLQARNSHQVLGLDLKTPADFIMCYTKDGKGVGVTGQALRIAKHYDIPIFDFGNFKIINDARIVLEKFLEALKEK